MSIQPIEAAAPPRRRLPRPLLILLTTWLGTAGFGAVLGLALAVTSLASGTPGTAPLARTGWGLFSGAFCGSLLALGLFGLYGATWALLALGRSILFGSVRRQQASGQPAANGWWSGLIGAFVGVFVGGLGGGLLGFIAIALWIGLTPTAAEMQAQAPFWGVVFGVLWGVPAGVVVGSLIGAPAGFVAGFRLGRRGLVPSPA